MSLLDVKNLKTYFYTPFGSVKAVDDVSFNLERGVSLGLVGESGCGKTTAALSIMRILPYPGRVIGGKILFKEIDMGIEEKGKPRSEGINVEAPLKCGLNVSYSVCQSEGQFLYSCGACLAYMITAYANRIPPGNLLSPKLNGIYD